MLIKLYIYIRKHPFHVRIFYSFNLKRQDLNINSRLTIKWMELLQIKILHGCVEIWNSFRVLIRISHKWACSTREINFTFPSIHVLLLLSIYVLLFFKMKYSFPPPQNREVNSNVYHDNLAHKIRKLLFTWAIVIFIQKTHIIR